MNTPDLGSVVSAIFGFSIIALGVFAISKPSKPPKQKDTSEKDAAAIELLKGGNAEEIAAREGISVEELQKWKGEFLDSALEFAKKKNELHKLNSERESDINWFMAACEKHIGSDWKSVTHYDKRNR